MQLPHPLLCLINQHVDRERLQQHIRKLANTGHLADGQMEAELMQGVLVNSALAALLRDGGWLWQAVASPRATEMKRESVQLLMQQIEQ